MNMCGKTVKYMAFVLIIVIVAISFCGCGQPKSANSYRSVNAAPLPSQTLASNSDFELNWNSDANAVMLKSLTGDDYWSDILYEIFLEGRESSNGNSPISITVANTKTLQWDTVTSYDALDQGGKIACKKIDNGVRVTYFFEKQRIAIPVEYTLRDDSINIAIDGRTILEDGTDYKLVSVSLTPNFCSLKNETENGYLFVPSGCGAIMSTKAGANGVRKYTGEVYGEDGARQVPTDFVEDEAVRLPVFGAAGGNSAILGIIEEGAGSAVVTAQAGNDLLGYSNVYAEFYVRGYDRFFFTYHGKPQGTTNRVNDDISKIRMSVGYYPLFGENAGYTGMAERYRKYLLDNGTLSESDVSASPYSVTFLGGTGITKSILGIPKKEIVALTTFSKASSIISALTEDTGISPVARLVGFTDSGVRPGGIAGGDGYLSVYGSEDELADLVKNNANVFMDYDIVRFSDSGNGFSLSSDVSTTAIKYKSEHFAITPFRIMDENNPYYIISRNKLAKAADFAIEKNGEFGNGSVALSTLGTIAFSDYSYSQYPNKNRIENDVAAIIKKVKSSGKAVAVAGANGYAAASADMVFDTVSTSGDYSVFDYEIPFYQMVFHSYKTMYSQSLNVCDNADLALARAAAYGMGASFTLTSDYVDDSDDLDEYPLYGTVFEDNRENIKRTVVSGGFAEIFGKTATARLIDYKLLENGVSVSVFGNGITVYANQTDTAQNSPAGLIKAYSFVAVEG
ncbi:MAG: hypothetical protein IK086_05900 [Clostridia bacterium]|nr:hypothetical protein [Clostridia bacterium]